MGLHSGHHLAGAERLGDIIVGSQAQSSDLVNVVLLGGNHNNRRILHLSDLPADLEPIHPRQHQIQNQKVKLLLQRSLKSCLTVIFNLHPKAGKLQIILLQLCDSLFVLNN